jgi:prephenate dehydrogenase
MWRDIFLDNRAEVLPLIDRLAGCVQELRAAVAAGDAARIEKVLMAGKNGRDRFIAG